MLACWDSLLALRRSSYSVEAAQRCLKGCPGLTGCLVPATISLRLPEKMQVILVHAETQVGFQLTVVFVVSRRRDKSEGAVALQHPSDLRQALGEGGERQIMQERARQAHEVCGSPLAPAQRRSNCRYTCIMAAKAGPGVSKTRPGLPPGSGTMYASSKRSIPRPDSGL